MATKDEVLKALSTCIEPELHKDIVTLGMVQNLVVEGGVGGLDLRGHPPPGAVQSLFARGGR